MASERIAWIDAGAGIAGDMLLGAILHAGGSLEQVLESFDRLRLPEQLELTVENVSRGSLDATRAVVHAPGSSHRRGLREVLDLIELLDEPVATRSAEVFRSLANAESRVHGLPVEEIHFHEVGALDSIADVVGVVTGLASLGVERLVCSPIALGSGRVNTAHGALPVPGPAVLELLRGTAAKSFGGPPSMELATPTGVALAVTLAHAHGPLPAMLVDEVGVGAGTADPPGHANVVRLVVGSATAAPGCGGPDVVLATNIDDLDPRLWPGVLAELLEAGASDAWLTPILMKKGRPAHMLSVLARANLAETLERIVFTRTTTIGLRRTVVDKVALPRRTVTVEVGGLPIRVKIADLDGEPVTMTPEYDDVAHAARSLGRSNKAVLEEARSLSFGLGDGPIG